MKTSLLTLFMALFMAIGSFGQHAKEVTILNWSTPLTNSPETLNGKIKQLNDRTYWAVENNGKLEKGTLLTLKEHADNLLINDFQLFFDSIGNVLRNDRFGEKDVIIFSYLNAFKDNKQLKEIWVNDNLNVIGEAAFKYNDSGFLKDIVMTELATDSSSRLSITSDSHGNMIQMDVYDNKNRFAGKTVYTWDENSHVIHNLSYSPQNEALEKVEITYNDHGFINTFKLTNAKGVVLFDSTPIEYTYDNKGNWVNAVFSNTITKKKFFEERQYIYY
jgi:uncharacterized lipoprotein NlpE involved in copper resistance